MALVTGDFLFVGDVGRPDLLETAAGVPGAREPSARQLQRSLVERLGGLPDFLQVLPAHGSGSSCGKALSAIPSSVLGYERRFNHALRLANSDAAGFVEDILSGQPDPPLYFARMKRVNRDGISVTGGPPSPRKLAVCDAAVFAAEHQGTLLDTRPDRAVFDAGHIAGALHAPFPGAFFLTSAGCTSVKTIASCFWSNAKPTSKKSAASSTASDWTISRATSWLAKRPLRA